MTKFSHDKGEPPMLNDSERPVLPPLNSASPARSGLKIFIFVAVFGLMSVSGLVWFALNQGELIIGNDEVPLVKADTSPIRLKPDNPGGLKVPNQDRLILKNLEMANPSKLEIPEKLIPRPEQPISTNSDNKLIVNTIKEKTLKDRAAAPQIPKIKSSQGDGGLREIKKLEKHENPKYNKTVARKDARRNEQKTSTKSFEVGAYRIQLASLANRQAAEKFLKKVRSKNVALLVGMTGRVMKVNLKSKGTFYRVQGDPISRKKAEKICKILRNKKQACLVVRN